MTSTGTTLLVRKLERRDDAELVRFLDETGAASASVLAYHYPFYRDILEAASVGEPFMLGVWNAGRMVGLLPGFIREAEAGRVYSSLPFFGPNAGVICANEENREEVHRLLLEHLVELLQGFADTLSASIYTPFLSDYFAPYDALGSDTIVVERFTQYLPIDEVAWSKEIRYDLRRGAQHGITIETEVAPERIERFYEIYVENCLQNGIPIKPKSVVTALANESERAVWYFAYDGDTMIGGLLVLLGPLTASYYIPCTLPEARALQPGTILIDRAIDDARRRGIRYWNWESSPSKESGVYKFKKKWGSALSEYRTYILPFRGPEFFREIGAAELTAQFPYFFVYPFNRL